MPLGNGRTKYVPSTNSAVSHNSLIPSPCQEIVSWPFYSCGIFPPVMTTSRESGSACAISGVGVCWIRHYCHMLEQLVQSLASTANSPQASATMTFNHRWWLETRHRCPVFVSDVHLHLSVHSVGLVFVEKWFSYRGKSGRARIFLFTVALIVVIIMYPDFCISQRKTFLCPLDSKI